MEEHTERKIVVIGTGYVGLVGAACFAEAGHRVLGVDIDPAKVAMLRRGEIPIFEPGLAELVARHHASGCLRFTTDLKEGIAEADAAFICVGTPQSEDGSADLQFVLQVAEQIGKAMQELRSESAAPLIVVDKSTVPVGTAARVTAVIAAHSSRAFEVVSSPEFLREGQALDDFLKPDRLVLGCQSDFANELMFELHEPFLKASNGKWFRMDPPSAEMTKYTSNAMLALRISFINEIARLAEAVGANIDSVKMAVGADRRIGPHFLNPGPGFGGSCFPKDLQALLKCGREYGEPLLTLTATVEANRHQRWVLIQKIRRHFSEYPNQINVLQGKRFALWGLAFKAHTDDIREAMSLELIDGLLREGASVCVHDFAALGAVKNLLGDRVEYAEKPLAACQGADALIIATEWPQYAETDLATVGAALKQKLIFDGRNLFKLETMEEAGWQYYSIGRRIVQAKG